MSNPKLVAVECGEFVFDDGSRFNPGELFSVFISPHEEGLYKISSRPYPGLKRYGEYFRVGDTLEKIMEAVNWVINELQPQFELKYTVQVTAELPTPSNFFVMRADS